MLCVLKMLQVHLPLADSEHLDLVPGLGHPGSLLLPLAAEQTASHDSKGPVMVFHLGRSAGHDAEVGRLEDGVLLLELHHEGNRDLHGKPRDSEQAMDCRSHSPASFLLQPRLIRYLNLNVRAMGLVLLKDHSRLREDERRLDRGWPVSAMEVHWSQLCSVAAVPDDQQDWKKGGKSVVRRFRRFQVHPVSIARWTRALTS